MPHSVRKPARENNVRMHNTSLGVVVTAALLVASCERQTNRRTENQAEKSAPSLAGGVPMSSEAADLLGKHLVLDELDWLNTPGNKSVTMAGKVTLVRWWTDTCPSCAMSLPAIERLRNRFAARGLQTLAVYHPKPPRDVAANDVLQMAKAIGYTGWVASDLQWKALQRIYLDTADRHSTSVCFLLDGNGIIRYVHPGPAFGPTDDPEKRRLNQDYLNITAAIEALVSQP
ncbi:MAG: hypothetical protein DHS20C16_02860 [Phycisphaerae bacterium]|nr:MAG: hypothetical protein DHS20C16_02860 [Phycisphaerae bacterium]